MVKEGSWGEKTLPRSLFPLIHFGDSLFGKKEVITYDTTKTLCWIICLTVSAGKDVFCLNVDSIKTRIETPQTQSTVSSSSDGLNAEMCLTSFIL